MKNRFVLWVIYFLPIFLNSQIYYSKPFCFKAKEDIFFINSNDTIVAFGEKKIKQFVGLDLGYSFAEKVFNYSADINFNYNFIYKSIIFRSQVGVSPFTTFGNVGKFFNTIGVTKNLNKNISWNIMVGFGYIFPERNRPDPKFGPIVGAYYSEKISYHNLLSGVLSTGFFLKSPKIKKLIIGINATFKREELELIYLRGNDYGPTFNIRSSVSLNYLFYN